MSLAVRIRRHHSESTSEDRASRRIESSSSMNSLAPNPSQHSPDQGPQPQRVARRGQQMRIQQEVLVGVSLLPQQEPQLIAMLEMWLAGIIISTSTRSSKILLLIVLVIITTISFSSTFLPNLRHPNPPNQSITPPTCPQVSVSHTIKTISLACNQSHSKSHSANAKITRACSMKATLPPCQ